MTQYHLIAVDVGKTALQIQTSERAFSVTNNAAGWRKIMASAAQHPHPLVICEASGSYERSFLQTLREANVAFRLVNPARVRGFATSEGSFEGQGFQIGRTFAYNHCLRPSSR